MFTPRLFCPEYYHRAIHRNFITLIGITSITNIVKNPPVFDEHSFAKILFLDGIRGAAVTLVVTQHARYMHDIFMGAVGVDAFFVLSSFLLTMIFMKKSIKLVAEGTSYRKWAYTLADYFSKRFF
ncbi:hypothetical protein BBO99_00003029 [Phytophthora kernoviae]|uniref:Acyltransferase 3 domain-containing protein n=2 Tax=Phytophthora kernoviae TaxID=325452 RepID=A0A3R7KWA6_9STRA|nr:hypothetical protein G195_011735 [Phytophthora kernoviae 00238/432]KAG2528598.1 hypothetical protein JM16_002648 [Phytophthora kernoviae]KAG2529057.1 hypothetical protein JM18_002575 [Phytophthora kernoviae]RLN10124.1 hypothetical protein BBI17_003093 [Phytophthora kernoviae]RLN82310.1 hypothetical protein BBO99_00003029 [Phytophthora kernoviae]